MTDKHFAKFSFSGSGTRPRQTRGSNNPHGRKLKPGFKIQSNFFSKNTLWAAKNLLGKYLCRRLESGEVISAMITESEAYCGFNDKASHASKGRTKRTEVMFAPAGTIYVYLIYGMYHCLNIVTEKKDYPAAVLIRGVVGVNGPGRVCRHFQITKALNGQKLGLDLWLEDRNVKIIRGGITAGPRIGVNYAGASKNWPRRFFINV